MHIPIIGVMRRRLTHSLTHGSIHSLPHVDSFGTLDAQPISKSEFVCWSAMVPIEIGFSDTLYWKKRAYGTESVPIFLFPVVHFAIACFCIAPLRWRNEESTQRCCLMRGSTEMTTGACSTLVTSTCSTHERNITYGQPLRFIT